MNPEDSVLKTHRDTIEIGWATSDDLAGVLGLLDCYDRPKTPWPAPDQQKRLLARIDNTGGGVVVARQGSSVVGTCTLVICPNLSWGGRPFGMIENVIVDPDQRRQRIGQRVLAFAVEHAKKQDCYKVALMTGSTDPDVHRFYRSSGFEASKTGFQVRFDA
ncbi:GNAT family N-acetyltransferase [Reinekea blandensis]|uniref:Acetyltransferase, GNAT family protein n=1 Tax=Reinekea blandensis MED297 TaxID=314283 RepID=A4BBU4_9GAMM|nr:GNAT family N-acetyltransferase [Reinekea blandensis]EAR10429.1 acetyltransferase, GNAT family protein [Reinekea sp. MED297] [Reinekea blandensis MED297]